MECGNTSCLFIMSSYLTHDPVLSLSSNTYRAALRELRSGNIDPGEFLWHPYDVYGAGGSFPISVCMLSADPNVTSVFVVVSHT